MQQFTIEDIQPKSTRTQSDIHWPSVWQLGLSIIGMLALWGLAFTLGVMAVGSAVGTSNFGVRRDSLPLLLMAAGVAFGGILLLPSSVYATLRMLNKPSPFGFKLRRPGLLIFLVPPLAGLGYLVSQSPVLVWIALPPLHVITMGVSILWLVSLGTQGLSVGSKQRLWGIFGTGMVAAPLFSLFFEFMVILVVGIALFSYLARDPVFGIEFSQIMESFIANPNQPPDAIFEILEPYLMQPVTVFGGLVIAAVFVPLIEELFKPVGVWLLAGRQPTPSQGFTAGVLSGAGFALFENITLSASSGEEWSLVVLARLGTSVIHILTTGLTGWALAQAFREGRYFRLGATFLLSVSIHALWNGMVVLSAAPELLSVRNAYPEVLWNFASVAPTGLGVLLLGGFITLLACNRTLRRAIIPPANTVLPAELQPDSNETEMSKAVNTIKENIKNGNHQLSD